MSAENEARGLADPFKGVTTNGATVPDLFPVKSTGVSTEPVRQAATTFLAALTPDQRKRTSFGIDDPEWRKWMNHASRGAGNSTGITRSSTTSSSAIRS